MSRPGDRAGTLTGAADLPTARERLWGALVAVDEYCAAGTVFAALDAGLTAETVLLEVIAPVQRRVGTEWAGNRLTVAQEHAATAINDRVIAAMAHHPASRVAPSRGRIAVACVDGEWHALPARLLAEVLRLRGWRIDFLGAQVPTPHLIAHVHQHNPAAVALSSSIPTRLPTAHAAISACQAIGTPVLTGGAAFGPNGRYARLLGADAWAPDAPGAAEQLIRGVPRPSPTKGHQPIDDLPHLADQEYTMVVQNAGGLVQHAVRALQSRLPAMANYSDVQRQRTVEDLGHIVDFLAVSLYTDDDELFTGFINWTAQILTARAVPAASLYPALDLLGEQLSEFPRAARLLKAARLTLSDRFAGPFSPSGQFE
jgi:methanogenic corrinoid protein MtbC1